MALNSYFDFAENDFQYFKASYDAGIVANMMGAMAQGICEKYMKHLISEYYKPDDAMQQKDFENILRTHSLNRLMKFLKANMGAEFSKNTQTHMRMIDGFYFSTRYPGDDSIEIDGDDVETCNDAIELCRKEVLEFIQSDLEFAATYLPIVSSDASKDGRIFRAAANHLLSEIYISLGLETGVSKFF